MHVHVVVQACRCLRTAYGDDLRPVTASAQTQRQLAQVLGALTVAYVVDLIGIYAFGVVPYSRCSPEPAAGGWEVLQHHLPLICGIVPLMTPFAMAWAETEGTVEMLAQDPVGVGRLCLLPFGWLLLSSVNEAIMCMQRVDLPRGVWNTWLMYVVEIGYKCLIFTVFASCSLYYCVLVAIRYLAFCSSRREPLAAAVCFVSSPLCLSILVLLIFTTTLYPAMARRALRKFSGVLDGSLDGKPPGAPEAIASKARKAKD